MKTNRKIFVCVFGVVVLLLVVAWQLAGGVGVGDVSEGSSTHTLYSTMAPGVTVNIDGIASGGEWDRASYASIKVTAIGYKTTRGVSIWLMNDDSFLYIMFLWGDTTQDGGDVLWFYFDEEHDHELTYPSKSLTAGYEEGVRHWVSEDGKLRRADGMMADIYWDGTEWDGDPPGGLNIDFESSWSWTGSGYRSEWKIPLNSQDRYDINVKSGNILGLYIKIKDETDNQLWAYPEMYGPAGSDKMHLPLAWDDLWTTKVFSASISHAHDEVGSWRAFLGVQNTGTRESTVVFRFSDYVAERTVPAGGSTSGFVEDFHGGTNYIGPILIYSNQPFTALMNQRNATSTIMGQTTYIGEN